MGEVSLLKSLQLSMQAKNIKEQKLLEKLSIDIRRSLINELNSIRSDTRATLCLVKKLPGREVLRKQNESIQSISTKLSRIFLVSCGMLMMSLFLLSLTAYLVMAA